VHVAAAFVGQAAASPGSAADDARYEGLDAEGLVKEFMAVASPEAFRLAGLLSAAPLNLPLMRGIQQAMSAEPRQAHLTEVLLSGLLRDVTPTADSRRSREASFTFAFKDGVRDVLLATVRRSEAISVLEFVSEAYSRGLGTAAVTSQGRIPASGGTASATPASDLDVYGEIEKTVLRRIGGPYARAVENARPAESMDKPPVPSPQQTEPYEDAHGIVMLGGPGSGKTTYLAALSIALFMRPGWRMVPKDDVSAEALTRRVQDLTSTRVFPMGSRGQVASYQWRINGEVERTKLDWRRRVVRYLDPVGIDFRVTDAGGEIFARPEASALRDELLDVLARSRGIIFLFDPTREFEVGDTFDYVHQVVTLLAQRMLGGQGDRGERLPHHVAVCVSKFDDDWVFRAAEAMGMVSYDPSEPYGFPQVADEDAREFLRRLCRVSPMGTAELAVTALEQFFHPERVKYFVTSAIGFHVNRLTREFDPHDRANYVTGELGSPVIRIRGAIHPIGVAEPVLWLGSRLTGIPT
jgi:hypothetical protein